MEQCIFNVDPSTLAQEERERAHARLIRLQLSREACHLSGWDQVSNLPSSCGWIRTAPFDSKFDAPFKRCVASCLSGIKLPTPAMWVDWVRIGAFDAPLKWKKHILTCKREDRGKVRNFLSRKWKHQRRPCLGPMCTWVKQPKGARKAQYPKSHKSKEKMAETAFGPKNQQKKCINTNPLELSTSFQRDREV